MSTNLVGPFIYPRMFALVRGFHAYKFPSDLDTNEKGLPPLMRCTGQGTSLVSSRHTYIHTYIHTCGLMDEVVLFWKLFHIQRYF